MIKAVSHGERYVDSDYEKGGIRAVDIIHLSKHGITKDKDRMG